MIDHYEMPHPMADHCRHAGVGKACRPCRQKFHWTADDLRDTPAGRALMAEAWEDGAQAAWGESGEGWNGEYTGRSGPPSSFRMHNPTLPNPYREETPNE